MGQPLLCPLRLLAFPPEPQHPLFLKGLPSLATLRSILVTCACRSLFSPQNSNSRKMQGGFVPRRQVCKPHGSALLVISTWMEELKATWHPMASK